MLLPKRVQLHEQHLSRHHGSEAGPSRFDLLKLPVEGFLPLFLKEGRHGSSARRAAICSLLLQSLGRNVVEEGTIDLDVLCQLVQHPLIHRLGGINVACGKILHISIGELAHRLPDVFIWVQQGAAAQAIHDLALSVHHIIVLEDVLSDSVEIVLDLLLSLLQGIGQKARLQGHIVRLAQTHHAHHLLDVVTSKDAENCVV
mmetsp:Transcript_10611/g.24957  ORF Transcript_10611/g.24957 Transcript_10611/m.24957 type:complete len:201 (-) Transcript_10611:2120-2722(-)